ncbi:MAG: Smr/MutS family protein [Crocinitomicaceae bacterium]|nr:Smr/MutS family protein [Crocinitomicaceae bacterium]
MSFQIGDKVNFLNEAGGGKVIAVDGNTITVETDDGFDYQYQASQLVLAGGNYEISDRDVEKIVNQERNNKQDAQFYKKFKHLEKMNKSDEMEVDLHIESLIDSHKGMPNYQIIEVQMAEFKRKMNAAISRNMKRIVFIHGVGAGVLREEIRSELRTFYPGYEFLDGSYQRYGGGATEVLLRG